MGRPAIFAQRHLVIVSALLLAAAQAATPLTDPSSEPFLVDTSSEYVLADTGAKTPAAAFNGTEYLVTWQDIRNGQWDIYAGRMSLDGRVIDTAGFPVSLALGPQQNPVAASDGDGFLVVWEDQRSGVRWNIYAARLDSNGHVLDTAGILLRSLNGDKHSPAVAYGAGRYLVTWDEYYGSRNIVAAFVDTNGQVSEGIEVCAAPDVQGSPSVAFGDSAFLVAWDDTRNSSRAQVYAARITQSGVLLDSGGFPVLQPHDAQTLPSVAYDGTDFLITWQEGPVLNNDILAARVAPNGVVLDTGAIRVSIAARDQSHPRAAFADSCNFIIWEDRRNGTPDVYYARVTTAGQVADSAGIRVSSIDGPKFDPVITAGAGQLLAAWQDGRTDSLDHGIRAARASPAGLVLDTVSILVSPNLRKKYTRQDNPSLTFGDSSWLVVWTDYRPDTLHTDIYAMRLGRSGNALDGAAIRISSDPGDDRSPRAAFDGSDYLIVWQDSSSAGCDICGRRLTRSGALLDTADIPITSTGNRKGSPVVAYDGSDFLVVWQELMTHESYIYGRRVSTAGSILDTIPIPISVQPGSLSPAVSRGDSWSLVLWRDSSSTSSDINVVRVTREGRVLDRVPATLNHGIGRCRYPAVARGGDQFFVVWVDRPANLDQVLGALVRWSGQDPETAQVTVYRGTPAPKTPAVAFNGRDYLVAWRWPDIKMAIRGARVTQTGAVMDLFDVLTGPQDYYLGDMAVGSDSTMFVVLTTMTASINGQPANCNRVWGLLSPLSGVAENVEPARVSRLECTPNPFTHSAAIRFSSGSAIPGQLRIYDVSGRTVRSLSAGPARLVSSFTVVWDGLDDSGRPAGPGCYFVRYDCDGIPVETKLVRSH